MVTTEEPESRLTPWWRPHTLTPGQSWHCAQGPLSLFLQREAQQWSMAWEHHEELADLHRTLSEPATTLPEHLKASRYVFAQTPSAFCLKPRLLERPMVVKTHHPVRLPPGQDMVFYISSPVKIAVMLQEPEFCLETLPTLRLSDTWFGPNTQEGELCFAARTHARNNREELPLRSHRAVTPVSIKNRSGDWLAIDKLSIPLPFLTIYGGSEGSLWTNSVSLKHTDDNALAAFSVGDAPPEMELLAPAQQPMQRNGLVRAFTSFFPIDARRSSNV